MTGEVLLCAHVAKDLCMLTRHTACMRSSACAHHVYVYVCVCVRLAASRQQAAPVSGCHRHSPYSSHHRLSHGISIGNDNKVGIKQAA